FYSNGLTLNIFFSIQIFIFLIAIIILFYIFKALKDDNLIFGYFIIGMVIFYAIGYLTNNLINSRALVGAHFEHYHAFILIPLIFTLLKRKANIKSLTSFLIGGLIGLSASDYSDIIKATLDDILLLIFYTIYILYFSVLIESFIKKKKFRRNEINV
ncbi:MAG: hypothetical protein ACP6IY_19620, partial [Promethearchaeia archaeon]